MEALVLVFLFNRTRWDRARSSPKERLESGGISKPPNVRSETRRGTPTRSRTCERLRGGISRRPNVRTPRRDYTRPCCADNHFREEILRNRGILLSPLGRRRVRPSARQTRGGVSSNRDAPSRPPCALYLRPWGNRFRDSTSSTRYSRAPQRRQPRTNPTGSRYLWRNEASLCDFSLKRN